MPSANGQLLHTFDRPFRGRWFQFRHPFVVEYNTARLPVPSLHPDLDGLRILHLTDLHLRGRWSRTYDKLIEHLDQSPPDLLLCTGDFVDSKRDHSNALPHLYRILEHFRARLGVFGVLGNHDREKLEPDLAGTSVRLVGGQRELFPVGDARVEVIGLPGVLREDMTDEWVRSVPARASGVDGSPPPFRIVLSHYPDHLRRTQAELQPDLFLAGHTHGGQVCLPYGVPILKHDSLPRRLCTGIHRVNDTWLVIPRGIGATTIPLRVFCPPEVIEIVLKRDA